jgi:hypothetical protein
LRSQTNGAGKCFAEVVAGFDWLIRRRSRSCWPTSGAAGRRRPLAHLNTPIVQRPSSYRKAMTADGSAVDSLRCADPVNLRSGLGSRASIRGGRPWLGATGAGHAWQAWHELQPARREIHGSRGSSAARMGDLMSLIRKRLSERQQVSVGIALC